jgi:transposase-like protein
MYKYLVDKQEIDRTIVKLYQLKKKQWVIVGYKCPHCYKHYQTLHKPTYEHIDKCEGISRELED